MCWLAAGGVKGDQLRRPGRQIVIRTFSTSDCRSNGPAMSRVQAGEEKKMLLAPCAEEYTASLKCEP